MKLTHEPIEKILYDGMASHTALGRNSFSLSMIGWVLILMRVIFSPVCRC